MVNIVLIGATGDYCKLFMILLFIMLFLPSYLPAGAIKTVRDKPIGVVGIAVAAVVAAGLFKHADDSCIFDFKKIANLRPFLGSPLCC